MTALFAAHVAKMDAGEPRHACDKCLKTYQRRDLLLRHRRRCLRLKKSMTRRKACNACVQAKAKCSYAQPSCSRCAQRGIPCQYLSLPIREDERAKAGDMSGESTSQPTDASDPPVRGNTFAETMAGSVEPSSTGGSQLFPWSLDKSDLPSMQLSTPTAMTRFGNPVTPPATDGFSQGLMYNSLAENSSLGLLDLDFPTVNLDGLDADFTPPLSVSDPTPIDHRLPDFVFLLKQYPKLLLRDDFSSPFLHHSLYSDNVPDMTTLARTSTAICCGSAIGMKDGARYVKRAMDAERQRLIDAYPSYQCMQQWDALHAMLIYAILEMELTLEDDSEAWKQKPPVKGLKSPFLVKMTQCLIKSHSDSSNADFISGSSSLSWNQWTVAETTRRTIFLANMINFLGNRDSETGQKSPYYEPLNNKLILNMPLPCSHALWTARTEYDWTLAMQLHQTNPWPAASDPLSVFDLSEHNAGGIFCLKNLFSRFTKDHLRTTLMKGCGFDGSDELRSFIILCALEQYL
ncbi:hypothetical protein L228DRAFT_243632 [Xylona heveae TC161]|uniref:Zn(2)-C6 fungal-type domain-containing protein n=1 Tax=Xylona heveae (strain CBS 132557 / TC161) TaxID=1328760 RepID=A0A165IH61_XYLHT|nr:hypothetical protein L228DRAFT_243632 [Xylona heveae TC161]KZF24890.1 hypothetical protein L228DRAFT_243632 [Xylona heveae TC161]